MSNRANIIYWNQEYRDDFIRLNREWIEQYFRLEPADWKVLSDPEGAIIQKGGQIFFAVEEGNVLGCCALVRHPETETYELAKMAVTPTAQGKGLGYLLGKALLSYATAHGVRKIYLEANTRMAASVHLYHKLGFKDVEMTHPVYDRCDLCMEISL